MKMILAVLLQNVTNTNDKIILRTINIKLFDEKNNYWLKLTDI